MNDEFNEISIFKYSNLWNECKKLAKISKENWRGETNEQKFTNNMLNSNQNFHKVFANQNSQN